MKLDATCQRAIELVKAVLPEGGEIDVVPVLDALVSASEEIRAKFPEVVAHVAPLEAQEGPVGKRPVAARLRPLLAQAAGESGEVRADALFRVLVLSSEVAEALLERGLSEEALGGVRERVRSGRPEVERGESQARAELGRKLAEFGRLLPEEGQEAVELYERERLLPSLVRPLVRMLRNDVLLVGSAGVGKTTVARELARRVAASDESLPGPLRQGEVFEFAPGGLTRATSPTELHRRVGALMELLEQHRGIVLLIDPLDAVLAGDPLRDSAQRALEDAVLRLIQGPTPVLACASTEGFHALQRRPSWQGVFDLVHMDEPAETVTVQLLAAQLARFREHYGELEVAPEVLGTIVRRADRAYPGAALPRRAIQLLDDVCVANLMSTVGQERVDLDDVDAALQHRARSHTGRAFELSEEHVVEHLGSRILGQDAVLGQIARTFVASLGTWTDPERPRAIFLFGGPTGVGKTETAVQLAQLMGGATPSLIRVDCNTLQRSGHDAASVLWPLLGVPLGFVGHGEGGVLSAVARRPDSVVLFDEFEKADPAVGKLLLQVLDTGLVRDHDGVVLDFRRAVLVFTTNLGVSYERQKRLGFGEAAPQPDQPRVELEAIRREMLGLGYGQEFIARIRDSFLFQGLDRGTAARVVGLQLERLAARFADRGLALAWPDELPERLAEEWEPRFGVRQLINEVEQRIAQQVGLADMRGELKGVDQVRLEPSPQGSAKVPGERDGSTYRLRF